ncbi:MAG: septum formation initiator family protein [Chlorobi bacterium]|nr:septum formation initiator family protein [Chlorobiota bacterium]
MKNDSLFIKVLKNKFFIAIFIFALWIIFFDEYSLVAHHKNKNRLKYLLEQQAYYKEKIKSDRQKIEELNAGKAELEKYAREQYKMSKPDEDLFIIIEKKE